MAGKKYSDIFKVSNTANVADSDLLAIERSNGNTYVLRANTIYNYIIDKISNSTLSIGNTTVNTQINSTTISVRNIYANNSTGNPGSVLTSDGTKVYWAAVPAGVFSNGFSYIWSASQTFDSNVNITELYSLSVGNSTVNVSINSTSISRVSLDGGDF